MAISSYNPAKIRPFPGDVFLAAYPTADPGTDVASRLKAMFGLWYADGQKKAALTAGKSPWGMLKADGLTVDPKYKNLEQDINQPVPKIMAGFYPESVEVEITLCDPSRDKLGEALSAVGSQLINTAAAAGQSGQSGLLLGPQIYPTPYVFMFRSPSPQFPGLYDHFLLPRAKVDPSSIKLEFSKTKLWELKLKLRPEGDLYLTDPNSTVPVWGYYEETTAAAM